MTSLDPVNGTSSAVLTGTLLPAGTTSLSPDALLAFIGGQLHDLDGQIQTEMNTQNVGLQDRHAIQTAEQVLQSFGTKGPQNNDPAGWQKCVDALNSAISQVSNPDAQAALRGVLAKITKDWYEPPATAQAGGVSQQVATVGTVQGSPGDGEWQGQIDALNNAASGIKDSAEIQFLQLQDLVSRRQQVVQECSGMMSKVDQTLEDQAKAIGR